MATLDKNEIISFLKENQHILKEQFHLTRIALFGSFARGEQSEESDIDLLIELEENIPNIYELKTHLREFIGDRFHRRVDIARIKYLRPYAKQTILNEAVYVE